MLSVVDCEIGSDAVFSLSPHGSAPKPRSVIGVISRLWVECQS